MINRKIQLTSFSSLPFTLVAFCLIACFHAALQAAPVKQHRTLVLPLTSETVLRYDTADDKNAEYLLHPEAAGESVRFNEQELAVPVQSTFTPALKPEWQYYEAGRFMLHGTLYTIILYNYPGEFDDLYLNIQLNSYKEGKLIDALVLDTRYQFEDVEGFSTFTIEKEQITIQQWTGYYWDAENPEAGTITRPVHQLYARRLYQMDNGYFRLLSEDKYPVSFILKSRADH